MNSRLMRMTLAVGILHAVGAFARIEAQGFDSHAHYPSTPYPQSAYSDLYSTSEPPCYETCQPQPQTGSYYAEAELMFLRAHVLQGSTGKLSEQYQLTPRFILGYEAPQGLGGRIRYWHYNQATPNLSDPTDPLRMTFDVIDLEGTHRFGTPRAALTVAGGFRWATMDIEVGDEKIGTEMPGITFAADLRGVFCRGCNAEWASVAGARWTMLGGDWEGSSDALIARNRDDNIVTHEFYGGVEYRYYLDGMELYSRIVFEVQNWHSDALSQTGGTDSIGFVGPGIQLGASF